jgi:hypothetical protein
MIKNQGKLYRVVCGGMDTLYMSTDQNPQEAAAGSLSHYIKINGDQAEISPVLCVYECDDNIEEEGENAVVFYTASVLENIGLFTLAKNVENLSNFLLDNP